MSEDVRKWTVNDVYNFINSIPTCSEYAQVRSVRFFLALVFSFVVVSVVFSSASLFVVPLCRRSRTT